LVDAKFTLAPSLNEKVATVKESVLTSAHPLRQTRFTTSANLVRELPPEEGAEVAFAGRSNAGKSSALNTLCDHSQLARVSKTPGRTQLLNVFGVSEGARLIDLPGYGYAKVPGAMRDHWRSELQRYFDERESLKGLILVMDIRHPLKEFDLQMLEFCAHRLLPCHVLLTKADKLGRGAQSATAAQVRKQLKELTQPTTVQTFSMPARIGIDEARTVVCGWLGLAMPEMPRKETV